MHDKLAAPLLPETKNDASLLLLLSIAYYYQYHRHLQCNVDAHENLTAVPRYEALR